MIRVDFSVPFQFEAIPIGIDFTTAWAEVNARNARLSRTMEQDQLSLTEMARSLQQVSCLLDQTGAVYAANCLHSFQGELSLGSLAVVVVDFPYGNDTRSAAQGTLRAILASRGAGWAGTVFETPCGQAAVFTGGQSYELPPAFSKTGEPIQVLTTQLHAVIPIPSSRSANDRGDSGRMCLIAFSTPNHGHWEKCYAPIMASVLRSLQFTEVTPARDRDQ
ncbi:hypothetical protein [Streptomyces koyangensis]